MWQTYYKVSFCLQRGVVHQTQRFRSPAWCSQIPFICEGVAGLLCDETRKLSLSPLPPARGSNAWSSWCPPSSPGEVTRWARRVMAAAIRRVAAPGEEDSGGAWLPAPVQRIKLFLDPAFAANAARHYDHRRPTARAAARREVTGSGLFEPRRGPPIATH